MDKFVSYFNNVLSYMLLSSESETMNVSLEIIYFRKIENKMKIEIKESEILFKVALSS